MNETYSFSQTWGPLDRNHWAICIPQLQPDPAIWSICTIEDRWYWWRVALATRLAQGSWWSWMLSTTMTDMTDSRASEVLKTASNTSLFHPISHVMNNCEFAILCMTGIALARTLWVSHILFHVQTGFLKILKILFCPRMFSCWFHTCFLGVLGWGWKGWNSSSIFRACSKPFQLHKTRPCFVPPVKVDLWTSAVHQISASASPELTNWDPGITSLWIFWMPKQAAVWTPFRFYTPGLFN